MKKLGLLVLMVWLSGCAKCDCPPSFEMPIPGELRILRSEEEPKNATSRCIGNPTTTLCAIDTYMAYGFWFNPDLARKVGVEPLKEIADGWRPDYWDKQNLIIYQVLGEKVISKETDLPDVIKEKGGRVGDTAMLVQSHGCAIDSECLIRTVGDETFGVDKDGDRC